jgi:polysaccharide export outer membrane protein
MALSTKEGFSSMKTLRILFGSALLLFISSLYHPYAPALAQTGQTQPLLLQPIQNQSAPTQPGQTQPVVTQPGQTQVTQPSSEFELIKEGFTRLSPQEKLRRFANLSDDEKRLLFKSLPPADQVLLFQNLSDADRAMLFSSLSDEDKVKFFLSLGDLAQRGLIQSLPDDKKAELLSKLTVEQREQLQRKFPDLVFPQAAPPGAPPVQVPAPEKGPSEIEKIMSGQFPTEISRELRQFGYDFFDKATPSFTPILNVPVGPEYVIGPGDSFTINLWGKAEQAYNVSVTNDGSIIIPRLGALQVSGLTFAELKRLLNRKFKDYYPEFEMSVTMDRIRTIQIFIVGEAKNPGTYSVSSLSTIITALFAAGGPTKNGSLRDIRLFRDGALIKSLDLYEFFIKGSKGNDVRLQPGDTIFIPVLGPVVGIAGCVKRPAIYEMKGPETIGEMLDTAGGVLPLGYLQNVVVERIKGHDRRVVKSFNLDPSFAMKDENLKMLLQDGDVVKIYPIYKKMRQVVYLEGHVKQPREYELKHGMRLLDIIPSYDALLPEPYRPQAEIIRLMPPDLHPEIIAFNLGELLAGDQSQNLLLQDMDRVVVYGRWEKKEIPQVSIKGAVRQPGYYRLYQGMTVKDLIFQAGNLTDTAFVESATLTRVVARGEKGTETLNLTFSPQAAMTGNAQQNLVLQKDDSLYIRDIPQYSQALERKIYLDGEFLFPGEYSFSEGEHLDAVIKSAGGLTPEAYPFGAVFQRESVKKVQDEQLKKYIDKLEDDILTLSAQAASGSFDKDQAAIIQQSLTSKRQLLEKLKTSKSTGRMVINLSQALALATSPYNIELRAGDRLIVPKRPDTVNVLGEVYNPTALLYEKDKTTGDYLAMVGGPTENAEKSEIYVVKANGSVISKSQGGGYGLATWDTDNHRWILGGFDSRVLDAGDTVIVPKKIEVFAWAKVKDITQVLYQIAVAAGVFIAAFK